MFLPLLFLDSLWFVITHSEGIAFKIQEDIQLEVRPCEPGFYCPSSLDGGMQPCPPGSKHTVFESDDGLSNEFARCSASPLIHRRSIEGIDVGFSIGLPLLSFSPSQHGTGIIPQIVNFFDKLNHTLFRDGLIVEFSFQEFISLDVVEEDHRCMTVTEPVFFQEILTPSPQNSSFTPSVLWEFTMCGIPDDAITGIDKYWAFDWSTQLNPLLCAPGTTLALPPDLLNTTLITNETEKDTCSMPCPQGYFCNGYSSMALCPEGTYSPIVGLSSCLSCPASLAANTTVGELSSSHGYSFNDTCHVDMIPLDLPPSLLQTASIDIIVTPDMLPFLEETIVYRQVRYWVAEIYNVHLEDVFLISIE